jgi:hypothetical protein
MEVLQGCMPAEMVFYGAHAQQRHTHTRTHPPTHIHTTSASTHHPVTHFLVHSIPPTPHPTQHSQRERTHLCHVLEPRVLHSLVKVQRGERLPSDRRRVGQKRDGSPRRREIVSQQHHVRRVVLAVRRGRVPGKRPRHSGELVEKVKLCVAACDQKRAWMKMRRREEVATKKKKERYASDGTSPYSNAHTM